MFSSKNHLKTKKPLWRWLRRYLKEVVFNNVLINLITVQKWRAPSTGYCVVLYFNQCSKFQIPLPFELICSQYKALCILKAFSSWYSFLGTVTVIPCRKVSPWHVPWCVSLRVVLGTSQGLSPTRLLQCEHKKAKAQPRSSYGGILVPKAFPGILILSLQVVSRLS